MVSDYDRLIELQSAAYNSAGQSTVQFNKYQDTVEYKMKQIKNTWEQLRVSLLNQDVYKQALDIGNKLISSIKKDISVKDLAAVGVIGLTIGKSIVNNIILALKNGTNSLISTSNQVASDMRNQWALRIQNGRDNITNKIGRKILLPIMVDKAGLEQSLQEAESQYSTAVEKINHSIDSLPGHLRNALEYQGNPISLNVLARYQQAIMGVSNVAELSDDVIRDMYRAITGSDLSANSREIESFRIHVEELRQQMANSTDEVQNFNRELQNLATTEQNLNNQRNMAQGLQDVPDVSRKGQVVANIVGTAITTAATEQILTGSVDWKSVGVMAFTSFMSEVPQLLSNFIKDVVTKVGIKAFASAFIPIAVATIVTGVLIHLNKVLQEKEVRNPIEDLKKEVDDLKKQAQAAKDYYKEKKEKSDRDQKQVKDLENIKQQYDELKDKIVLSEEEVQKMADLHSQIQEEYPELLGYYDEANNKLILRENTYQQLLDDAKEMAKISAAETYSAGITQSEIEYQSKNAQTRLQGINSIDTTEFINKTDSLQGNYHWGDGAAAFFGNIINLGQSALEDSFTQAIKGTSSLDFSDPNRNSRERQKQALDYMNKMFSLAGKENFNSLDEFYDSTSAKGPFTAQLDQEDNMRLFLGILSSMNENGEIEELDQSLKEIEQNQQKQLDVNQQLLQNSRANNVQDYFNTVGNDGQVSAFLAGNLKDQFGVNPQEWKEKENGIDGTATDFEKKEVQDQFANLYRKYSTKEYNPVADENSKQVNAILGFSEDHELSIQEQAIKNIAEAFTDTNLTWDKLVEKSGMKEEFFSYYSITADNYTSFIKQGEEEFADVFKRLTALITNQAIDLSQLEITQEQWDSLSEEEQKQLLDFVNNSSSGFSSLQQEALSLAKAFPGLADAINNDLINKIISLSGAIGTVKDGQVTGGMFQRELQNKLSADEKSNLENNLTRLQKGDFKDDAERQELENNIFALYKKALPNINFSNLNADILNNITAFTQGQAEKFDIDDNALHNIQVQFTKFYSSIGDNEEQVKKFQQVLNSNIWQNMTMFSIDEDLQKLAEEFNLTEEEIKKFKDLGYTAFKNFEKVSATSISNTVGEMQTFQSKIEEIDGVINSARDEQIKNGKISTATIKKLNEAGLQDYYEMGSNGYQLSAKANSQDNYTKLKEAGEAELKRSSELIKNTEQQIESLQQKEFALKAKMTKLPKDSEEYLATSRELERINKLLLEKQDIQKANVAAQKELIEELQYEAQYHIEQYEAIRDTVKEAQDAYDDAQKAVEDAKKSVQEAKEELDKAPEVRAKAIQEAYEEEAKAIQDAKDAAEDAFESLQDAYESLADAEKELADAQNELYEAIHGSADWESSLDRLDTANQVVDGLNKRLEVLKENMEDATTYNDIVNSTEDYIGAQKDLVNTLTAKNVAQQNTLNNMMAEIMSSPDYANVAGALGQTVDGRLTVDIDYLKNADANDEIKNALETFQQKYNDIVDDIYDNNQEIKKLQDEWVDVYKNALDKYVGIQEKVGKILEDQAKEEIETQKEKYESLKEADNEYTDALEKAIQKQRELRDQANEYEELAQKEKKLSLLARDTSGANQKDVLELQNNVEESRQNLLDKEVDNLIESMKELYQTQQEAREKEIEYLESVMETTQFWVQANEIMSNWQTPEQMVEWFMSNDPAVQDMSTEQQIQYAQETEGSFSDVIGLAAIQQVLADVGGSITDAIQADVDQVNAILPTLNISEEVGTQVMDAGIKARDEMIATAEQAVIDQQEAVAEAQKNVTEMELAYQEAQDNITKVTQEAAKTREDAVKAAYEAEQQTTETYQTAVETLREKEQDAQDKANELTSALNQMKAMGFGSINEINSAIAQLQNDCVRYLQDLANWQMSEASQRYYIDLNETGAATSKAIGEREGASLGENIFLSEQEAQDWINSNIPYLFSTGNVQSATIRKYAEGGMVDYTGPAWVDGTKSKPEAFLDPEDTANIGALVAALRGDFLTPSALTPSIVSPITQSNLSNITNNSNTSYSGGSVNITLNIDSIASDYDVDRMMEIMEERITMASNPIGTSVFLHK